jgi:hypothetical protein
MKFQDRSDVYIELEPFDTGREKRASFYRKSHDDETKIASDIRVCDDQWIETMCGKDVDQFLSSIHKKKDKHTHSAVSSIDNFRNKRVNENRGDFGSRGRYNVAQFSPDMMNNNIININDRRDDDVHFGRTISVKRKNEDKNEVVNSGGETLTSTPRNRHYVKSTESSGDDSIGKQEGKRRQKPSGRYCRLQGADTSLASEKLILDDLIDMEVNVDNSLEEEAVATSRDRNGKSSPLWKLLWERRWEWAQERVRLHPEEARKQIQLPIVSIEDLQTNEENDDFYSALPLHLACVVRPLPPTALLRDLIDAYPEACHRCQELSGMLPIHMAANLRPVTCFRKASLGLREMEEEQNTKVELSDNTMQQYNVDSANHGEIIELLLESYPISVLVRESINGMTALHIAASTTRAENGIVSPVASNVLNIFIAKGPIDAVHSFKDKKGMTPHDWAWRNVDYFCPRCGMENATNNGIEKAELLVASKKSNVMCDNDAALLKLDADSMRCKCIQSLSVSEICLHPLLRKEIQSEANEEFILSTPPTLEFKSKASSSMHGKKLQQPNINCKSNISPRELDNIRECTNTMNAREGKSASLGSACKKDRLASDKTANLYMKIRLSELVHPSNHGRRRGSRSNGKKSSSVPNPYFEVFAAHRCGMSRSYYKSYPLHGSTEGTWEDAFLDLGLTHKQLQNGTNGASHIEIGIRVMHCSEKGSDIKVIGMCQMSLENLERQQQEMLQKREQIRHFKDIVGGVRDIDVSLPEPESHPILKGFEVTGNLQVLSLTIK